MSEDLELIDEFDYPYPIVDAAVAACLSAVPFGTKDGRTLEAVVEWTPLSAGSSRHQAGPAGAPTLLRATVRAVWRDMYKTEVKLDSGLGLLRTRHFQPLMDQIRSLVEHNQTTSSDRVEIEPPPYPQNLEGWGKAFDYFGASDPLNPDGAMALHYGRTKNYMQQLRSKLGRPLQPQKGRKKTKEKGS